MDGNVQSSNKLKSVICGDSLMKNDLFQQVDGGANPTSPLQLFFKPIKSENANKIFETMHYAHRAVPISEAFGAYKQDPMRTLVGAISFGKPASPSLCDGACGKENSHRIYELNRLWMSDECPKNSESRFIGWSLRQIRKFHPHWILVSYADTEQNHTGIIYKATGWIYTGLSAERGFDWGCGDGKHSRHAKIGGEGYFKVNRSRKHRYFYFFNKDDIRLLKYQKVEVS